MLSKKLPIAHSSVTKWRFCCCITPLRDSELSCDADAVTPEGCWEFGNIPGNFWLNRCSRGNIISIQSVDLWFSRIYDNDTCEPLENCAAVKQEGIMSCNGRLNCSFPRSFIIYRRWCYRRYGNGYNISITYNCVASTRSVQCSRLLFTAYLTNIDINV